MDLTGLKSQLRLAIEHCLQLAHTQPNYQLELPFWRACESLIGDASQSPDSSLLHKTEAEYLVEIAWERLHSVYYKDVPEAWLVMYTVASCLLCICILDEDISSVLSLGKAREAIRVLDMALIMSGAPVLHQEIVELLVRLQAFALQERPGNVAKEDAEMLLCLRLQTHMPTGPIHLPGHATNVGLSEALVNPAKVFPNAIPRIHANDMSFTQLQQLVTPIVVTHAIDDWPAITEGPLLWQSNIDKIMQDAIGLDRHVPIEIGRAYTDDRWSQQILSVRKFLQSMLPHDGRDAGKYYLAQHGLARQIPRLANMLRTPDYCLMMPAESENDVQVNYWLGPVGTTSPLHTDPRRNWFVQLAGYKYVRLYAPEDTHRIYPFERETILNNTSQITDLDHVDVSIYPLFMEARPFECVVGPGELL
jgi:lysine-specific demethylase 8